MVWMACAATVGVSIRQTTSRARLALASVLFIYLALVLASVVLHVFVVCGRTARQVVPFLRLLTAHELFCLLNGSHRRVARCCRPRRTRCNSCRINTKASLPNNAVSCEPPTFACA